MRAAIVAILLSSVSLLAGCVDNTTDENPGGEGTGSIDRSMVEYRDLPATITGLEEHAHSEGLGAGGGIWLYGHYAYVSGHGAGLYIVDIIDPARPVLVGHLAEVIGDDGEAIEGFGARDVDILDQGDRLIAVLAWNSGGMHFVDVTDPTEPYYLNSVTDFRSHNVAVPPGQSRYVYNSMSSSSGSIHIVDAADPSSPQIVKDFGTHGCHDITFLDLPGKKRAYCPGISATEIWDIEDILNPTLISSIEAVDYPWTDSLGQGLHHLAIANHDGTILVLGDEWQGGGSPGACFLYAEVPVVDKQVSTPFGALTFFDITDESAPVMLSWITPPTATPETPNSDNPQASLPSCTSHFGMVIEDRPVLIMAWYTAGVIMVEFSDPTNPTIIEQFEYDGIDVWDARFYQGYVFTGDIARGMDVLTFE